MDCLVVLPRQEAFHQSGLERTITQCMDLPQEAAADATRAAALRGTETGDV